MDLQDFDIVKLSLALPGEDHRMVLRRDHEAETINYRTQRSEKSGLFDERIFGPDRDYECYCGKYRGIRYKGIVCEKCGVEITRSIVRRERMGHIELASPVSHICSYVAFLRDRSNHGHDYADLEKVVYSPATSSPRSMRKRRINS